MSRPIIPTPTAATILGHLLGAHGYAAEELLYHGPDALCRLHEADHAEGETDHNHAADDRPRKEDS